MLPTPVDDHLATVFCPPVGKAGLEADGKWLVVKTLTVSAESTKRASWVNMRPLGTVSSVTTTGKLLCGFLSAEQLDSGLLIPVGQCLHRGLLLFLGSSVLSCPPLCLFSHDTDTVLPLN